MKLSLRPRSFSRGIPPIGTTDNVFTITNKNAIFQEQSITYK